MKRFPAKMPVVMELAMGYACGQNCVFCLDNHKNEKFRHSPMTAKEIARILVSKWRQGVTIVDFTGGGEPTFHPLFPWAVKVAKQLGFKTHIISNGSRLCDPAYAAKVFPYLDELCLSLHGDAPELLDALTRTPGGFARLMRAFANARACKTLTLETNTVVTQLNLERIWSIFRLALKLGGVARFQLSALIPDGRAQDRATYDALAVSHEWWRRELPALISAADEAGVYLWVEGLTPCVMGKHQDRLRDGNSEPTVSVDRAQRHGVIGLSESRNVLWGPTEGRVKPPVCVGCVESDRCLGIFTRYVDLFGVADIEPIKARKN